MAIDYISEIKSSASKLLPSIIELRRDLHQHPELSFQESRTSSLIKSFLKKHGIDYTEGWAGHGIIGSVRGKHNGPMVMLRGDMDALPIQEDNDVPYKSIHQGIMHACGHDVHTSCLMGAAVILQEHIRHLHGEVKLIFQPGEEKLPGGASIMIKEGLFQSDHPDWIIGQHVHPPLPAGHVGFKSGLYMASADEIYITVLGKGGHAATPHQCIDPIVIAAKVITSLQELVSRNMDPIAPCVLTIGRMYSDGGATNVIPNKVFMEGTLRMMDEEMRSRMHTLIRKMVEHMCMASGATAEINIIPGYPSLKNDEKVTSMCREKAVQYLGEEKVHDLPQRMSSEDFAFYTQQVPASFYRLGTGWPDPERNFPVHSSKFDINETAMETGMGLMAYITMAYLGQSS